MQKHIGYINRSNRGHKFRHGQESFEVISSWRVYEEDGELRCTKVRRDYRYEYDDSDYDCYTRIFEKPYDLYEGCYEVLIPSEKGDTYGVNVYFEELFLENEYEEALKFCKEHNGEMRQEKSWISGKLNWWVKYLHHFEEYGKIEEECDDFYDYDAEYQDRELTDARPIEL